MDTRAIRARDAAVQRLRRLTAVLLTGAGTLALVFTVVAAKAFPGRAPHTSVRRVVRPTATTRQRPTLSQAAPPLTAVGSQTPAEPQAPSASAPPAPVPGPAPSVAVPGGS